MLRLLLPLLLFGPAEDAGRPGLRDLSPPGVLVGTAAGAGLPDQPRLAALVGREFNAFTPENATKPLYLHPAPDVFDFAEADRLVDWARANDMAVIGHTLVWHQQSPPWLFEDADGRPLPRKVALANIERYITTVVTHFRGRVHGWDVVNEAVNDPGRLGEGDLRDTPALRAIGPDYVEHAFRFARAADPGAELYYNDFHIERHAKREATLRLLAKLKAAGVAPDAVGIQAHWHLGTSMDEVRRGVAAYVEAGWPIMLTELDVSVLNNRNVGGDLSATREAGVLPKNPYPDGLPADVAARQAEIYALAFSLPREFPGMVRRITLWGFTDERTWLHDFPVRGRRDHPLVFDADLNPKPAYHAAAAALQGPAGE